MKILTIVVIFVIFCQGDAVNPRSINLNLDTSFVVDHDDDKATFLEKVKKVFDKIKQFFETLNVDDIISKKKEKIHVTVDEKRFLKFFSRKIGKTALKHDNNLIKDLVKSVAEEISSILDRNEFADTDFKKSTDKKIKRLLSMKAKKIKAAIRRALKAKGERLQNFERKLRDFYDEKDRSKLKRIIARFEEKSASRKSLKKVVKDAFSVLFHEKYDKLDKTSRITFINEIKDLIQYIKLEADSRRVNDRSDSDELTINLSNSTDESKERNKISFKKDIEIVVNSNNSEDADT